MIVSLRSNALRCSHLPSLYRNLHSHADRDLLCVSLPSLIAHLPLSLLAAKCSPYSCPHHPQSPPMYSPSRRPWYALLQHLNLWRRSLLCRPWSALLDHYCCGHRRLPLRSPRHHHNSVGQPCRFPPRRWRRIVAIAMPHWSPPTTRCHCRLLCLKRHRRRSVLTPPPTVHHRHPQIVVEKTLTSSQAPAPPFSIEGHVQVHLPFFLSRSAPSPLPRPDFFRVGGSGPVLALCQCWRSLQTNFNRQYS